MINKTAPLFLLAIATVFLFACQPAQDCSRFKNGKFYTITPDAKEKVLMERQDSIQIEKGSISGIIVKSKVRWTGPCEYELYASTDNKKVHDGLDSFFAVTPMKIAITATGRDYYVFNIRMDSASKHVEFSDTTWVDK